MLTAVLTIVCAQAAIQTDRKTDRDANIQHAALSGAL